MLLGAKRLLSSNSRAAADFMRFLQMLASFVVLLLEEGPGALGRALSDRGDGLVQAFLLVRCCFCWFRLKKAEMTDLAFVSVISQICSGTLANIKCFQLKMSWTTWYSILWRCLLSLFGTRYQTSIATNLIDFRMLPRRSNLFERVRIVSFKTLWGRRCNNTWRQRFCNSSEPKRSCPPSRGAHASAKKRCFVCFWLVFRCYFWKGV